MRFTVQCRLVFSFSEGTEEVSSFRHLGRKIKFCVLKVLNDSHPMLLVTRNR